MFLLENMYNFIEQTAIDNNLKQTLDALPYAEKMHRGQFRKGKRRLPYITHPLQIACHAITLGLVEDDLIATILLHDVCEDCVDENGCDINPEDLPVSEAVQTAVGLVSKPKIEYDGWKNDYYSQISTNRLAIITKVLDRCHNISNMAEGFSMKKIEDYITVTEEYIMPLLDIMETDYADTCYNASFIVRYHMESILGTLKNII